jgi:hypothetical protein
VEFVLQRSAIHRNLLRENAVICLLAFLPTLKNTLLGAAFLLSKFPETFPGFRKMNIEIYKTLFQNDVLQLFMTQN